MMRILTQKMLGAQGLADQLLASGCWLETKKVRVGEVWEGHGFSRAAKSQ